MSFMLFLAAPTAERQHRQQQHHAAESHSRVGRHLGRHRLAKKQNAPSHRNSPPEKVNSENKPTRKSLSLLALPAICISVAAMGCNFFFWSTVALMEQSWPDRKTKKKKERTEPGDQWSPSVPIHPHPLEHSQRM